MAILFLLWMVQGNIFLPDFTVDHREYLVRNFTVEDGLPVNSVNAILQDDIGYLYFSTLDGLVRYDGYDFVTFNSSNTPGIYNDRIARIMKTSDSSLWMISESGVLTVYREGVFKTYTGREGIKGEVSTIKEGPGRKIWISTTRGVASLERSSDRFIFLDNELLSTSTWGIEVLNNNDFLAVNKYGLVKWSRGRCSLLMDREAFPIPREGIVQVKAVNDKLIFLLGGNGFFCLSAGKVQHDLTLISDQENFLAREVDWKLPHRLLFTTNYGFYEVDTIDRSISKLPIQVNSMVNRTNSVMFNKKGERVLLGDNEVVVNGKIIFRTADIQSGFIDREGSIWISSIKEGLFQLRESSFSNIGPVDKLPIENIYPIVQAENGDIWAGSLGRGIFRIKDTGITQWDAENSGLHNSIARYLFRDHDGTLYAGLWDEGLWRYNNEDWIRIHAFDGAQNPSNITIEAMHRKSTGELFIGTHIETVVKNGADFQIFRDAEGKGIQRVRVIRENKNGDLLFGTNGDGLGVLSGGSGMLTFLTEEDGLNSNFIRDIYLQSQDTVWLATENRGLTRIVFNDTLGLKSISRITVNDGLTDNSLHRIIEDPYQHLWISSNAGIMRISTQNLNSFADNNTDELAIISFDERDGMISREANGGVQSAGILTSANELWFPTQKGITIVDPADFINSEALAAPKPIVEYIVLKDTLLKTSNVAQIPIPRGERNIRFKFTAPNFAYSGRIQIKYRLSGVDEDWQVGNEALEAGYTNLDPGTYQFDITAERINGNISEASSLAIIIPPFFYETAWFYSLLMAGALLLIYSGYRYRLGALQRRKQKLQQQVNEQTKELQKAAEEKSRFFSGITHELKTPLSLILGPLDDMMEDRDWVYAEKWNNYIPIMHRNGYRLKNLVDQILDVTKLNADAITLTLQPVNLVQFTRQVAGQFQSQFDQKEIRFEINFSDISELIYVDKEAWERIIINLISNAIKHSPPGKRIILSSLQEKNMVMVAIKDFGHGISKEDQQQIFNYLYQVNSEDSAEGTGIGLYLVKGLVERMGGLIKVESEQGQGAEFIVKLKKGYLHFDKRDIILHTPLNLDSKSSTKSDEKSPKERSDISADSEHILIVEDNADFQEYLNSLLTDYYRVSNADNGNDALKKMERITPDLIISDVMMPGMNGLDFVNSVRKIQKFRYLPVIFLSAKDRDEDVEAGLSTGADVYLTKPIRSKTLRAQIAAVLRRERILKKGKDSGLKIFHEPVLVLKIKEIVYRQLSNPNLSIEMLANSLLMSRSKLYREWNKVSDTTLNDMIKKIRLEEGKDLILEENFSVQEAARAVGYTNSKYFSTSFKNKFGQSPTELK